MGSSRVSLDVIVEPYENGMTPEQMVQAYDTRDLVAYYLRHRSDTAPS